MASILNGCKSAFTESSSEESPVDIFLNSTHGDETNENFNSKTLFSQMLFEDQSISNTSKGACSENINHLTTIPLLIKVSPCNSISVCRIPTKNILFYSYFVLSFPHFFFSSHVLPTFLLIVVIHIIPLNRLKEASVTCPSLYFSHY